MPRSLTTRLRRWGLRSARYVEARPYFSHLRSELVLGDEALLDEALDVLVDRERPGRGDLRL
ncbi:MAG: hypothetical protein ACK559_16090, partial [bacterium]